MKLYIQGKHNTGFTLIEMLVYIAVLTIIVMAVYSLLLWAVNSNTKMKVFRESLDNNRRAMELITYEIREAKNILGVAPSSLSLGRADGTIIDFYLCGAASNALCLKRGSEAPALLTSNRVEVANLNFTRIATSSIQISLGVAYQNPAGRPEYQALVAATSTISLRPH